MDSLCKRLGATGAAVKDIVSTRRDIKRWLGDALPPDDGTPQKFPFSPPLTVEAIPAVLTRFIAAYNNTQHMTTLASTAAASASSRHELKRAGATPIEAATLSIFVGDEPPQDMMLNMKANGKTVPLPCNRFDVSALSEDNFQQILSDAFDLPLTVELIPAALTRFVAKYNCSNPDTTMTFTPESYSNHHELMRQRQAAGTAHRRR